MSDRNKTSSSHCEQRKTYSNADVAVQADPRIKVKESENVKTV